MSTAAAVDHTRQTIMTPPPPSHATKLIDQQHRREKSMSDAHTKSVSNSSSSTAIAASATASPSPSASATFSPTQMRKSISSPSTGVSRLTSPVGKRKPILISSETRSHSTRKLHTSETNDTATPTTGANRRSLKNILISAAQRSHSPGRTPERRDSLSSATATTSSPPPAPLDHTQLLLKHLRSLVQKGKQNLTSALDNIKTKEDFEMEQQKLVEEGKEKGSECKEDSVSVVEVSSSRPSSRGTATSKLDSSSTATADPTAMPSSTTHPTSSSSRPKSSNSSTSKLTSSEPIRPRSSNTASGMKNPHADDTVAAAQSSSSSDSESDSDTEEDLRSKVAALFSQLSSAANSRPATRPAALEVIVANDDATAIIASITENDIQVDSKLDEETANPAVVPSSDSPIPPAAILSVSPPPPSSKPLVSILKQPVLATPSTNVAPILVQDRIEFQPDVTVPPIMYSPSPPSTSAGGGNSTTSRPSSRPIHSSSGGRATSSSRHRSRSRSRSPLRHPNLGLVGGNLNPYQISQVLSVREEITTARDLSQAQLLQHTEMRRKQTQELREREKQSSSYVKSHRYERLRQEKEDNLQRQAEVEMKKRKARERKKEEVEKARDLVKTPRIWNPMVEGVTADSASTTHSSSSRRSERSRKGKNRTPKASASTKAIPPQNQQSSLTTPLTSSDPLVSISDFSTNENGEEENHETLLERMISHASSSTASSSSLHPSSSKQQSSSPITSTTGGSKPSLHVRVAGLDDPSYSADPSPYSDSDNPDGSSNDNNIESTFSPKSSVHSSVASSTVTSSVPSRVQSPKLGAMRVLLEEVDIDEINTAPDATTGGDTNENTLVGEATDEIDLDAELRVTVDERPHDPISNYLALATPLVTPRLLVNDSSASPFSKAMDASTNEHTSSASNAAAPSAQKSNMHMNTSYELQTTYPGLSPFGSSDQLLTPPVPSQSSASQTATATPPTSSPPVLISSPRSGRYKKPQVKARVVTRRPKVNKVEVQVSATDAAAMTENGNVDQVDADQNEEKQQQQQFDENAAAGANGTDSITWRVGEDVHLPPLPLHQQMRQNSQEEEAKYQQQYASTKSLLSLHDYTSQQLAYGTSNSARISWNQLNAELAVATHPRDILRIQRDMHELRQSTHINRGFIIDAPPTTLSLAESESENSIIMSARRHPKQYTSQFALPSKRVVDQWKREHRVSEKKVKEVEEQAEGADDQPPTSPSKPEVLASQPALPFSNSTVLPPVFSFPTKTLRRRRKGGKELTNEREKDALTGAGLLMRSQTVFGSLSPQQQFHESTSQPTASALDGINSKLDSYTTNLPSGSQSARQKRHQPHLASSLARPRWLPSWTEKDEGESTQTESTRALSPPRGAATARASVSLLDEDLYRYAQSIHAVPTSLLPSSSATTLNGVAAQKRDEAFMRAMLHRFQLNQPPTSLNLKPNELFARDSLTTDYTDEYASSLLARNIKLNTSVHAERFSMGKRTQFIPQNSNRAIPLTMEEQEQWKREQVQQRNAVMKSYNRSERRRSEKEKVEAEEKVDENEQRYFRVGSMAEILSMRE